MKAVYHWPLKMTTEPKFCPDKQSSWADIVRWPAIICSPGLRVNEKFWFMNHWGDFSGGTEEGGKGSQHRVPQNKISPFTIRRKNKIRISCFMTKEAPFWSKRTQVVTWKVYMPKAQLWCLYHLSTSCPVWSKTPLGCLVSLGMLCWIDKIHNRQKSIEINKLYWKFIKGTLWVIYNIIYFLLNYSYWFYWVIDIVITKRLKLLWGS